MAPSMTLPTRRVLALLAVVVVAGVAACGGATAPGSPGASTVTIGSPLVGKPAPALAGTTLDGAVKGVDLLVFILTKL